MDRAGWTQFTLSRKAHQKKICLGDKMHRMARPSRIGERLPGVVSATPQYAARLLMGACPRIGYGPYDQSAATAFSATSQTVVYSPLNGFQQGSIEHVPRTIRNGRTPSMESHLIRVALRFCRDVCPRLGRQTCSMKLHFAPSIRRKWSRPVRDNPRQHQTTSPRLASWFRQVF